MVDYGDADLINQTLNDLTPIFKIAKNNSFDNTIVFKPNIFNVRKLSHLNRPSCPSISDQATPTLTGIHCVECHAN